MRVALGRPEGRCIAYSTGEDLSEDRGPPISSMRLSRAAGLAQEISNLVRRAGGYRAG